MVADSLRGLGLEPRLGRATSSVTAVIEGGRPGPTILLRADMDALPLQEDTGLDFASEIDGAMHACGHDTHVAMLLGAARLLVERREQLAGNVLLMFQPGEEGYHGARVMLDEGLLDGADVTRAVALHIGTRYAAGTIALRAGPLLASGDRIVATVRGRGGHASAPHLALDPITVAAELILALQTAVTRRVDVFDPAVVTISRISGGTTNNIIPESVELEGTIRTVSAGTRTPRPRSSDRSRTASRRRTAPRSSSRSCRATRSRTTTPRSWPGSAAWPWSSPARRRSTTSPPRSWAPRTSPTSSSACPA